MPLRLCKETVNQFIRLQNRPQPTSGWKNCNPEGRNSLALEISEPGFTMVSICFVLFTCNLSQLKHICVITRSHEKSTFYALTRESKLCGNSSILRTCGMLSFYRNVFSGESCTGYRSDVTWTSWVLKAYWLFVQQFVQSSKKGNNKTS